MRGEPMDRKLPLVQQCDGEIGSENCAASFGKLRKQKAFGRVVERRARALQKQDAPLQLRWRRRNSGLGRERPGPRPEARGPRPRRPTTKPVSPPPPSTKRVLPQAPPRPPTP